MASTSFPALPLAGLQVQVGYKNSLQKRDGWWDLPPCWGDREGGRRKSGSLSVFFSVAPAELGQFGERMDAAAEKGSIKRS